MNFPQFSSPKLQSPEFQALNQEGARNVTYDADNVGLMLFRKKSYKKIRIPPLGTLRWASWCPPSPKKIGGGHRGNDSTLYTPHILDSSSNLSWILSWVISWKGVVMWFNSSKPLELKKPTAVKEHAQYRMTTGKRTKP